MAVSESKKQSNAKWDKENMAYQTVKVRRELLDQFKAACTARGDKVNTVLRVAMERYIKEAEENQDDQEAGVLDLILGAQDK